LLGFERFYSSNVISLYKAKQGGMNMELLEGINWGLIAPLFIIQLILLIVSLVDLSRIEKTNGPKLLWVFIIVFVNIIGPILYFVIGRRND
jgi:uncharacterized membrane protein